MRKTLLLLFWTLLGIYAIFLLISPCAWAIYDISPHVWYRIGASSILFQIPLTVAYIQLVRLLTWYREKTSFHMPGWEQHPVLGSVVIGILIGTFVYLCVVGANLLAGWQRIGGFVHPIWIHAIIGLVLAFLVSLGEETIFRGYLFTRLEALHGTWPALILSTFAFSVFHLFGTDPWHAWQSGHGKQYLVYVALTLVQKGSIGILFVSAYLLRRRFWMAVGCHCGWDWLAFLVGSDPQSTIFRNEYLHSAFGLSGIGTWIDAIIVLLLSVLLIVAAKRNGHWRYGSMELEAEEPADSPLLKAPPRTAQPLTVENRTMTIRLGPQPYLSELLRTLGFWAVAVVFVIVMMGVSPHDFPIGIAFVSIPFAVFLLMSLSSLLGTCSIRLDKDSDAITINGRRTAALTEIEKVTMDYQWGWYGMLRFRVFLVLDSGRKILVAESAHLPKKQRTFSESAVYRQLGMQEEDFFDSPGDWQSKLAALGEDDTFRHFKAIHNSIQAFLG